MSTPGPEMPATAQGEPVSEIDPHGGLVSSTRVPNAKALPPLFIRAEIIGQEMCTAEGLMARGSAPVLRLCRSLIAAGFDPARPLHAYRGEILCLIVRTIGEGAKLTVKERPNGPTFERWEPFPVPRSGQPFDKSREA